MNEIIKKKLATLPDAPGIYKMLDKNGSIIYIGKSKCLKKRVKSYFVESPKWEKVLKMAPLIEDIDYVVTDTHLEALLLECSLIKSIQPFFNVQYKNDNRYVFAKVNTDYRKPAISIVYDRDENCFGPFKRKRSLQDRLDALKKIYPITYVNNRYQFDYHILPLKLSRDDFTNNSQVLQQLFLHPEHLATFITQIETNMSDAALANHFEIAIKYRDILQALDYIKQRIERYEKWLDKNILLTYALPAGYKLLFVAKGQLVHMKSYKIRSKRAQNAFINESLQKSMLLENEPNQKNNIDYRDILYTEIASLPEENVLFV